MKNIPQPPQVPRMKKSLAIKRPAFTFVEIVIVIMIIAIFSGGFVLAFGNTRAKATFDSNVNAALSIVQKARNLSLTNLQTNENQTDHYTLSIATGGITLRGYAEDGDSEELESLTFDTGISSDSSFDATYTPPYGEISLSGGGTSQTFTMSDGTNSSSIEISIYGGFPEISY